MQQATIDDQDTLSSRQIFVIAVSAAAQLVDFLDFFLISFVLAFIVVPWHLTVGETTIILLSSGVGATIGSAVCGAAADRVGRRPIFLATIATFTIGTAIMAFTPDGSWLMLCLMRFIVGFGATGMYSTNVPLLQEFMPARKRGLASGIVTTFVPIGVMVGSGLVAAFGAAVGWRGLFVIGAAPGVVLLAIAWFIPESPIWLLAQRRETEARASLAWALDLPPDAVALPDPVAGDQRHGFMELFKYPRSLVVSWIGVLGGQVAYYGMTLWAPVLLVLLLNVTPAHAAFLLIFCNLADVCARAIFAYVSERAGRRLVGILQGFVGAALLVVTAWMAPVFIGGVSVFWLMLMVTYFFVSGGFAVTVPYAAEVWPVHLRATGLGSAYGVGSLGKIIGPLGLGLMLGSSNVISPAASVAAVLPAFGYLAAWIVATGVVFLLFARETRGKTFHELEADLATPHAHAVGAGAA